MKTLLKTLKWVILGVVILAVGFVLFVFARANRTYEAPYPDIMASQNSAVIARGKALVFGPAHCADCHAPASDFARVDRGEEVALKGGIDFVLPIGTLHAPIQRLNTGTTWRRASPIVRAAIPSEI